MARFYMKPDPFYDYQNEYIELREIEIKTIEGGCCDTFNILIENDIKINAFNLDDIQENIEELWNESKIPIDWRNN